MSILCGTLSNAFLKSKILLPHHFPSLSTVANSQLSLEVPE